MCHVSKRPYVFHLMSCRVVSCRVVCLFDDNVGHGRCVLWVYDVGWKLVVDPEDGDEEYKCEHNHESPVHNHSHTLPVTPQSSQFILLPHVTHHSLQLGSVNT